MIIYVDKASNTITSTTPIADHVNDTYPTPLVKRQIDDAKIIYRKTVQVSSALTPVVFRVNKIFRKGLRVTDNSTIKVAFRCSVSNTINLFCRSALVWFK